MTTPAQAMKEKLQTLGLPFHEIQVYGSQITVECIAQDSCRKWASLLSNFAKVRGMIRSVAYAKKQSDRKTFGPKTFEVWRVYAAIV